MIPAAISGALAILDAERPHPDRDRWAADPVAWTHERRDAHVWSKQAEILRSVADNPRTAVKSCHGIGKSWTAADVALWWIDAHDPGDAIVVSTAPTYQQVHAILWEEIRKGHRAANLPGVVLKSDEWQGPGGEIVGFGRKPADTDEHGFQGIHRRFVLVILDEACGIPKQLFTAAEAIATNEHCRILAIGNPDDPNTEFGAICKPGSGYHVITVSAFETPNFTGETVPERLRDLLISPAWVDDKRRRWGTGSPLWRSKVEGKFPEVSENTLIQPGWITAAQARELTPGLPATIGVDVARMGSDHTVLAVRQGGRFRVRRTIAVSPTTQVAGEVLALQRETLAETGALHTAQVDTVGVGGGVADMLRETGCPVVDMVAGAAAQDSRRFINARAEWFWQLRLLFEAGQVDIDPGDDELAAQLGGLRYSYTSRGQIKIESKDDMRARGMPSPDRADAMMLAFATPTLRKQGTLTNYDYG